MTSMFEHCFRPRIPNWDGFQYNDVIFSDLFYFKQVEKEDPGGWPLP